MHARVRITKKVEMVRGENSQKTLEYIGGVDDNSNLFLCKDGGVVLTWLQTLETQCWG